MRASSCIVGLVFLGCSLMSSSAFAWDGFGHMEVAAAAWELMGTSAKSKAVQLLKVNPQYKTWIKGVSTNKKNKYAFMMAATWPDYIKGAKGYHSDGPNNGNTPPPGPEASQNIGYTDHFMHKYWHFVDQPFSPSHLHTTGPKIPNALIQIGTFTTAINGSTASDDIKSYDVVWLEHLVGDVHQPLHTTSRFTKGHPDGDNGGNLIKFCQCRDNLHAFWDDILGTHTDITTITQLGDALLARPKPAGADLVDPDAWVKHSFDLATQHAYIAPISDDAVSPPQPSARPNKAYHDGAQATAEDQVLLAGYRLAALLNSHLK